MAWKEFNLEGGAVFRQMPDPFATLSSGGPSAELFLRWHYQKVLAESGNGIGQSMEKSGAV